MIAGYAPLPWCLRVLEMLLRASRAARRRTRKHPKGPKGEVMRVGRVTKWSAHCKLSSLGPSLGPSNLARRPRIARLAFLDSGRSSTTAQFNAG